jgi:DNA-binding response OmpR family regulator
VVGLFVTASRKVGRKVRGMSDSSRILLVEDDPALAKEIVRSVEREGWAVDHVTSLSEAFEAIIQKTYRAVLLDRRLPDGDGLVVIAAAKSRPSPPPIIILTPPVMRSTTECRVSTRALTIISGSLLHSTNC